MRILIEEYQYPADRVSNIIEGITNLRDVDGKISVNYVGYYYNPTLKDCVFILPKVLLEGESRGQELVFGNYRPEDIIDLENQTLLTSEEHDFIYELAVWIYRAISVYRDTASNTTIIRQQNAQEMGRGRLRKSNTFLDILLALQKFNKDNQNFFFFIIKNLHSGYNKINWTRTIANTNAIVQGGNPIYLNPVNKRRQINFDEELLIIFFSILQYIHEHYGFPITTGINFQLITGSRFETYLKGMGAVRLRQIKYKYFSDKALYLWELCYAFFDRSRQINVVTDSREYLLAQNFNIVFEAIIDELIGSNDLPKGLKEQDDGKLVDHLYQYRNLTNNDDDKPIYYIGDSKYYKRGHRIGEESVYKQFTYARNVIQWNIDLFNGKGNEAERIGHVPLRDDVTEGYNVIPNFFISAQQKTLKQEDDIHPTDNGRKTFPSEQFENRLFDRDTFLVAHYDVNFLFVVALYGRNNSSEKRTWREKVRKMFRNEMQKELGEKYQFYAMTAKEGVSAVGYIENHFQQLLGKVFTPYEDLGEQKYYSLALNRDKKYVEENEAILAQLKDAFYYTECHIGDDPRHDLPKVDPIRKSLAAVPSSFLTQHHLENYEKKGSLVVIGCYRNSAHLDWILGKNDKGTLIYNIRADKERDGGYTKTELSKKPVAFVILYQYGHESEGKYRVFHVHHHAFIKKDRMESTGYPSEAKSDYFCYVFDEEVTLGKIDINSAISQYRMSSPDFKEGQPIFITCKDLINYREVRSTDGRS